MEIKNYIKNELKKKGFEDFGVLFIGKDTGSLRDHGRELGVKEHLYFVEELGRKKEGALDFPPDEVIAPPESLFTSSTTTLCVKPLIVASPGDNIQEPEAIAV